MPDPEVLPDAAEIYGKVAIASMLDDVIAQEFGPMIMKTLMKILKAMMMIPQRVKIMVTVMMTGLRQ